jgi:general stress protein 26
MVAAMQHRTERADLRTVWDLIKDAHVAVLVTVGTDGSLDSRPMGCVQKKFDSTVWFMTFNDMPKLLEIAEDQRALVSYAQPSKYEFVALSGRARIVDDRAQVHALWNEALRVWFPGGPDSPNLTLIAVDVEEARTWTKPASMLTYAYYYLRARLTGQAPRFRQIGEFKSMRL